MTKNYDLSKAPDKSKRNICYIHDPRFIDRTLLNYPCDYDKNLPSDNIRAYVRLDISEDSILRRLEHVIADYGAASEENESSYYTDVMMLVNQIEVYDQYWHEHEKNPSRKHSRMSEILVIKFINELKDIPDECAETFPYDVIDMLEKEYSISNIQSVD